MGVFGVPGIENVTHKIASILKAKAGRRGGLTYIVFRKKLFQKMELIAEIFGTAKLIHNLGATNADLDIVFQDKKVLANPALKSYLSSIKAKYAAMKKYGPKGITVTIEVDSW